MEYKERRIAILQPPDTFIPTGGVYHFVRGLLHVAEKKKWQVDVITTNPSSHKRDALDQLVDEGANIIRTAEPVADNVMQYFQFERGASLAELANMQAAFMEAHQKHIYDLVICHPWEYAMVPRLCGLQMPVLIYTHNPNSVHGKYTNNLKQKALEEYLDKLIMNDVVLGTQTNGNGAVLSARGIRNTKILPLPFPDPYMFERVDIEKEGVGFCGRMEPRKGYSEFLELIRLTKLPARVLTSKAAVKKWEKKFDEIGCTDYEISYNLFGAEKRDWFAGLRVFFMPSNSESFGYAFAEAIPHTHAVALSKYEWTNNFDERYCNIVEGADVVDVVQDLYERPEIDDGHMNYIEMLQKSAELRWENLLNEIKVSDFTKTMSKSFVEKHRNFYVSDLHDIMGRKVLNLDEIKALYTRQWRGEARVLHSASHTWFSLDKLDPMEESGDDSDLFDFG